MGDVLKSGVYRHYKGEHYLLLFVGTLLDDVAGANEGLIITMGDRQPIAVVETVGLGAGAKVLFTARAHGPMQGGTPVCIYVPLYTHKPGRRISVRPVADFFEVAKCDECTRKGWHYVRGVEGDDEEGVCSTQRFVYVGDEIPRRDLT